MGWLETFIDEHGEQAAKNAALVTRQLCENLTS